MNIAGRREVKHCAVIFHHICSFESILSPKGDRTDDVVLVMRGRVLFRRATTGSGNSQGARILQIDKKSSVPFHWPFIIRPLALRSSYNFAQKLLLHNVLTSALHHIRPGRHD